MIINRVPEFLPEVSKFFTENALVARGEDIFFTDTFEVVCIKNEIMHDLLWAVYDVQEINSQTGETYVIHIPLSNSDIPEEEFIERKKNGTIFIAKFGRLACYPYTYTNGEFLFICLASSITWLAK